MPKSEKGIPIPPLSPRSKDFEDFCKMSPGDSQFYPSENPDSIRSTLGKWRDKTYFEITTRTVFENGQKGIRVWRIK